MSINTDTLQINIPSHLQLSREQLLSHPPFKSWLSTLSHSLSLQSSKQHPFAESPYALRSIDIHSADFFGSRIGFLKFNAQITNGSDEKIPGTVFLRGGSVTILLILEEERSNEQWVVLTVQPRVPAGSLEFVELPAGMLDDDSFSGAAAKEIQEECGIEIQADRLIDLTQLALGNFVSAGNEKLEAAVYPSPGGCDERLKVYAYKHTINQGTLSDWKGKLTGLRDHGEKITLKIVKLENLWKETVDAKALSAVALWDGLKKEGKV